MATAEADSDSVFLTVEVVRTGNDMCNLFGMSKHSSETGKVRHLHT